MCNDYANNNIVNSSIFFNDTATTEIYTLSLHDALPIFVPVSRRVRTLAAFGGAILLQFFGPAATGLGGVAYVERMRCDRTAEFPAFPVPNGQQTDIAEDRKSTRLNYSHANISYAVFCLKKKKIIRMQLS